MENKLMFSDKALSRLILPLIMEQLLTVTVGMADVVMVSAAGETAVSGVSLVDSINVLLVNLFAALATGGSVVCARYLGQKNREKACVAANQLLISVLLVSSILAAIALAGNSLILHIIFGKVEKEVMQAAEIYFYLTAASYPFLAAYNGGAALCRTMGNSRLSMNTSFIINVLNIVGNALFVFVFQMGAAGVGLSTFLSRLVGSVIMIYVVRNPDLLLHIHPKLKFRFHWKTIKEILQIGIPNSLENSVFQIGKLMVQNLIASFGTTAIAANAVTGTLASFGVIPGSAVSLALITVVGQAVGAGKYDEAKKYIVKLLKVAHIVMAALNLLLILFCPQIVSFYKLSPEASKLAVQLTILHSICCVVIWPESFSLPNALRASNDAKYTMVISLLSMWLCRIALSYYFGRNLGMGVIGVWAAMVCDWVVRAICFIYRIKSGKWMKTKIEKVNA